MESIQQVQILSGHLGATRLLPPCASRAFSRRAPTRAAPRAAHEVRRPRRGAGGLGRGDREVAALLQLLRRASDGSTVVHTGDGRDVTRSVRILRVSVRHGVNPVASAGW